MELLLPLMLVMMLGLMFFSFRKQRRQMNETLQMQESLTVGTKVMTTTGLYGTITAVNEETLELEIAPGVTTTWVRRAIAKVITEDVDAPAIESIDDNPVNLDKRTDEE